MAFSGHSPLLLPLGGDLFNVVHHTEHQPLRVHLHFAPQGEPFQTLVGFQVTEHRLHRAQPLAVDMPPHRAVDLVFHPIHIAAFLAFAFVEVRHLTTVFLVGFTGSGPGSGL